MTNTSYSNSKRLFRQ